jgi:putative DNA primase/helicase
MAASAITFSAREVSAYYAARVPHLKQRRAAQWRGPCPIHQGKDDNFAVDPATGRWFCHSTCGRGGDILDLEEALNGGDFPTRTAEVFRLVGRIKPHHRHDGTHTKGNSARMPPTKPSKPPSTGEWREIARYPYVDQGGQLLFEVVRYLRPDGTKTFVQVRPSGSEAAGTIDAKRTGGVPTGGIVVGMGAGKYLPDPRAARATGKPTWKIADDQEKDYEGAEYRFRDCQRLPYRLPKVLRAETVYLPEGERDVSTVEAWGLVASCNPGGCGGSHLYAEWLDYFRARHIVILSDNDGPGRKHAAVVAAALLSVAASVRIVELPGLPAKGDITDWRDAGGTLDQFQELVQAATPLDAAALSDLRARWEQAEDERQQAGAGTTSDEWPEPLPIQSELPPVQPLREDLLPVSFRPLVGGVGERMQVPLDFPAAILILCLAGAVNRRARIQPKANDTGWVVVPNLWGGIIAAPGFMKSPVIQACTGPLHRIQAEWRWEHEAAMADYAREKEECELRRAAWRDQFKLSAKNNRAAPERPGDAPLEPRLKRLIVNDATFEAMHQTMNENPAGILVVRDELTGWWAQLDRAGREGERAFCLQAWNGDTSHTIDRIGRGTIHVPACCMSMLGGIQPGRLRSYLADALKDGPSNDGLIQRFQVMVWPDTGPKWTYVDRAPDAASEAQAARVFHRLVELDPESPLRFRFAPDAQELFIAWLAELEAKIRGDELHPALVSHLSKYRKLMPALALLFELADQAVTGFQDFEAGPDGAYLCVSLEHARQAAAWCDYLETHAHRIYSCVTTPQMRAAQVLAEKIKKHKLGTSSFSCRDVYLKGWSGLDNPELVRMAVEVLRDAGWVRGLPGESGPSGGRPTDRYEMNPKVWE